MKLLSEYYSDDQKRTAKVFKMAEKEYRVTYCDDFGITYAATFKSEEKAEEKAEDWIYNEQH